MTERRRVRRPGPAPVIWGSIALFAAMFALLAYQLAVGKDPALGAKASAAADPRPVLIRRVVKHRIVTTVVPTPGPSSVSSAPATAAPVPITAAPAPVVTSAS